MKASLLTLLTLLHSTFSFNVPIIPHSRLTSSQNHQLRSATVDEDGGKSVEGYVSAEEFSAKTKGTETIFGIEEIEKILPHRYPFALVDKVISYNPGKSAVGVKSVTLNEPQFTGHFPGRPIMPGVMQVEAMAQLAGIVCLQMEGANPGDVFFFAGVDGVKWKKPVVPGDTLVMEVEITKWRAKFGIAKAKGKAYVDGELALEIGDMTFALAK
mmetsp:Transcript_16910/g.34798  ORF Transcript_16910/g.34798 Transcript_16910/m.34798 type:complete len:213 (+) Transcript_16910:41-679(+)